MHPTPGTHPKNASCFLYRVLFVLHILYTEYASSIKDEGAVIINGEYPPGGMPFKGSKIL